MQTWTATKCKISAPLGQARVVAASSAALADHMTGFAMNTLARFNEQAANREGPLHDLGRSEPDGGFGFLKPSQLRRLIGSGEW